MFYISGVCGVEILYGERGEFRRFSSFRFFICQAKGMFVSLSETYDDASLLWWRVITLRKRNVSLQLEPAKFNVTNKEETRRL